MKFLFILTTTFFIVQFSSAQCIYEYEQEINDTLKYEYEEIHFKNDKDNVAISGTLISPKKGFEKLVIIVPGSGKDTRHSHFVLAEKYLENGIAVYRFDERGVGKSKGKYDYKATTLASDLSSCFRLLTKKKALSNKKIGALGHSLGGLASIISYENGCEYDFMILLGTPVEKGGEFIKHQAKCNTDGFYSIKGKTRDEVMGLVEGMISIVLENKDEKSTRKSAKALMKKMDFKKGLYLVINPLQMELIRMDNEETVQDFDKPMLYMMGSEDKIVSCENEIGLVKSLDNKMIECVIVKDTNHWLSAKISPSKMERALYQMNEEAANRIINWTVELK